MNKVIISAFAASLLLGFSQVGEAKEHKGPKADRGSSYSSQGAHNRSSNRATTRIERNHRAERNHSSNRDRNRHSARDRGARNHDRRSRHNNRHHSTRDRYRDNDRHHARHKKHHRARYRHHYRPRYKHYHPRTYPVNVYYLGQDWHYYGGYYHPFPRQHIHTRHCHHRYWEPLAVGVILGTVLGW